MTRTKKYKNSKAKIPKNKTQKAQTLKMKNTNKLIYWTGDGARNDGLHTPKEFLGIIQYQYPFWQIECLQNKNKNKPNSHYCGKVIKENDLKEWMKFANAKWVTK
jgi:hypothetical protein